MCLHGLQNQPIEVTITSKESRGLSGKRSQFKGISSTCICFLHEVYISYEKWENIQHTCTGHWFIFQVRIKTQTLPTAAKKMFHILLNWEYYLFTTAQWTPIKRISVCFEICECLSFSKHVTLFEVLTWHLPWRTKETLEYPQCSQPLGWDLNSGSHEYAA
jgi:hypothetical protein